MLVTCVDFHKFGILLDQNAKNNISRQKNIHYKDFNMLKQTKQTQNFAYMNNIIQALNVCIAVISLSSLSSRQEGLSFVKTHELK